MAITTSVYRTCILLIVLYVLKDGYTINKKNITKRVNEHKTNRKCETIISDQSVYIYIYIYIYQLTYNKASIVAANRHIQSNELSARHYRQYNVCLGWKQRDTFICLYLALWYRWRHLARRNWLAWSVQLLVFVAFLLLSNDALRVNRSDVTRRYNGNRFVRLKQLFINFFKFIIGFYIPPSCANTSKRSAASRIQCLGPYSSFQLRLRSSVCYWTPCLPPEYQTTGVNYTALYDHSCCNRTSHSQHCLPASVEGVN